MLKLISDGDIEENKKEAERLSWTFKSHPRFEKEKYLLQAQLEADRKAILKYFDGIFVSAPRQFGKTIYYKILKDLYQRLKGGKDEE